MVKIIPFVKKRLGCSSNHEKKCILNIPIMVFNYRKFFLKNWLTNGIQKILFHFYPKLWHRSYNGHMNQQKIYNLTVVVLTPTQFLVNMAILFVLIFIF